MLIYLESLYNNAQFKQDYSLLGNNCACIDLKIIFNKYLQTKYDYNNFIFEVFIYV